MLLFPHLNDINKKKLQHENYTKNKSQKKTNKNYYYKKINNYNRIQTK